MRSQEQSPSALDVAVVLDFEEQSLDSVGSTESKPRGSAGRTCRCWPSTSNGRSRWSRSACDPSGPFSKFSSLRPLIQRRLRAERCSLDDSRPLGATNRDLGLAGCGGSCGHLGCSERLALEPGDPHLDLSLLVARSQLVQLGDRHVPRGERHRGRATADAMCGPGVLHPDPRGRFQGLARLLGRCRVLLGCRPGLSGLPTFALVRWCSPVHSAHSKPRGEPQWTAWCGRCFPAPRKLPRASPCWQVRRLPRDRSP